MPSLSAEDRVTKSTKGNEAESSPAKTGKDASEQPGAPRGNRKSRQQMIEGVLKGEVPFSTFITEHPEIVMQMAERGYILFQEGAFDKAEQIFQGLAVISPEEPYYHTALGAIWLAQNKLDQAEKAFDEAIKLNEKWGPPLVSRGELYLRQGRLLDAASDFEKAIALDPESKEPETKHARLLAAATLANIRMALAAKEAEKAAAEGKAPSAPAATPASAAPATKSDPGKTPKKR